MEIKWIQFDFDNTLVDFSDASEIAFKSVAKGFGIDDSTNAYLRYKAINLKVWHEFEDKLITAEELRGLRFERYFADISERPCSGVEFNTLYLNTLIQETKIYNGVHETLTSLKDNYALSIITNGLKEVQRPRLNRLEMTGYFDSIIVSDEIGVSKPHGEYFDFAHKSISNPPRPEEILVVGDSLRSDIKGGNNFGSKTCWVSHGQPVEGEEKPDFVINRVTDILGLDIIAT